MGDFPPPAQEANRVKPELLYPEEIDTRLNWPLGTATRLARRRRLPHYCLPDGSLRFAWDEVEVLIKRVPAQKCEEADFGSR
jgi:hypothetical protein